MGSQQCVTHLERINFVVRQLILLQELFHQARALL